MTGRAVDRQTSRILLRHTDPKASGVTASVRLLFPLSIGSEIRIDLQHLERCLIKMIPRRAATDGNAALANEKERAGGSVSSWMLHTFTVRYFYRWVKSVLWCSFLLFAFITHPPPDRATARR